MVAEIREVESGKRADRPQLAVTLASCRTGPAVLVIAKLDRLARNARFLLSVVDCSGEVDIVFCDLPTVPAGPIGKFLITQMAAVAELEERILRLHAFARLKAHWCRTADGGWLLFCTSCRRADLDKETI